MSKVTKELLSVKFEEFLDKNGFESTLGSFPKEQVKNELYFRLYLKKYQEEEKSLNFEYNLEKLTFKFIDSTNLDHSKITFDLEKELFLKDIKKLVKLEIFKQL